MLKELQIANIILIEQAHFCFEEGFTVLSGETGAGKSAVMEALRLCLGAKTDPRLVRHGALKGSVIAVFDLSGNPRAKKFIQEHGFESDDPHLLIIQREITNQGKTRASLNHRPAQLSLLRELSEYLIELVGQHDNHKLFSLDQHLHILDLFGSYNSLKEDYEEAWKDLMRRLKELELLEKSAPGSAREIEICIREISEIEKCHVKEGEEEALFENYTLLVSSNERRTAAQELVLALEGVRSLLFKTKGAAQNLSQSDPKFSEELALHSQLLVETEELLHTLTRYDSKLDDDPRKLEAIHQRLSLIEKIKKKYGKSLNEIESYLKVQKERLKVLENLDNELEERREAYKQQLQHVQTIADHLTQQRRLAANTFENNMTMIFESLNMQNGQFHVEITPLPLRSSGQDQIEFFIRTNIGEKKIALKENASGGELARVLLALHLILAGKEKIGTLIFDEIDANIGGTTAALIGEHLKILSQSLQIFVITHFPQVAKAATHHFQIAKEIANGRTLSQITYLKGKSRSHELARMAGVS